MPRRRVAGSPRVVYRTARCGLRVTGGQRRRLFGLLASAGDVWACVIELNRWRRIRQDRPLAGYQVLCRELAVAGPGTFGELDATGARSVLLDREPPYPAGQVRSVTLLFDGCRLQVDVTAEIPVAVYPEGQGPDPGRVAGVDLGVIRRWRRHRRRQRRVEARHTRRVHQAQHEAARHVIGWAVAGRIGTLAVGDPRGVLTLAAGRRHNQRLRDWRVGRLISVLRDKAEAAGITVQIVDERGTSSTCPSPSCQRRVPKPAGRIFTCMHCGFTGHRDLVAAATIAARAGGGTIPATPAGITHRRVGKHLPGVHPARRDPRRGPPSWPAGNGHLAGTGPPRTRPAVREVARPTARSTQEHRHTPAN